MTEGAGRPRRDAAAVRSCACPIALAMAIVGVVGYAYMRDWNWTRRLRQPADRALRDRAQLHAVGGAALHPHGQLRDARRACRRSCSAPPTPSSATCAAASRWRPILACAGFGAICGSSIATAATMAKVAYPSMKRFGYSDTLATGAIAAGGTLGIMIPPSTILVIYGVFTETNIGKLFAAGILPGILGALLLCLAVQYVTWRDPKAGPPGERSDWTERWLALKRRLGGRGAVPVRDGRHLRRLLHRHRGRRAWAPSARWRSRCGAARSTGARSTRRWSRARAPPRCCS